MATRWMRIMRWMKRLVPLAALVLAGLSTSLAAESRASVAQAFWQNEARIEAYERQATGTDHINVYAGLLLAVADPNWDRRGTGMIATDDVLMLPMARLPEVALDIALDNQRQVSDVTRDLLRMDKEYRLHLQNEVLPALREKSHRLLQRLAELTPVPAGRRPPGPTSLNPNEMMVWSGNLDDGALTQARQKVESRGFTRLRDYRAESVTLHLYPNGRIELVRPPTCTVVTWTPTSDRRDAITTTTRTTYQVTPGTKLSGERFRVRASVQRDANSDSKVVRQSFMNTSDKDARLVNVENGRQKLLYLYNGQDSVPLVPWRLFPELLR